MRTNRFRGFYAVQAHVRHRDSRYCLLSFRSDYLAKAGPGVDPTEFRKNCQLNLKVNVPQGFTYGIASADYRGFAHLATGATGLEKASYYFQGMSETHYSEQPFSGPLSDNWQVTDETEVGAIVYKPCGEQRNFNINTVEGMPVEGWGWLACLAVPVAVPAACVG